MTDQKEKSSENPRIKSFNEPTVTLSTPETEYHVMTQWLNSHEFHVFRGLFPELQLFRAATSTSHSLNRYVDLNPTNEYGKSPLFAAAERGHLAVVAALVSIPSVNLNQPNPRGWTPLFVAAMNGHVEVVRLLGAVGAHRNTRNEVGMTAVHAAALTGNMAMMLCLFEMGAKMDQRIAVDDGPTPLVLAASEGHEAVVEYLIGVGADAEYAVSYVLKHQLRFAEEILCRL